MLISFFVAIWRTKLINAFNLLLWCAGLVTITVVTPVFVLPHFKNTHKLGMFIVLVTGYLLHALAASYWWLALYGAALVFSQYKEDHDKVRTALCLSVVSDFERRPRLLPMCLQVARG